MSAPAGGGNYQAILIAMFDARFGPNKIQPVLEKGGTAGVSYGKSICKVDTGQLRDGIGSQVQGQTVLELFSKAPHSVFVNNGTWKMSGDGYFDKMIVVTEKTIKEGLSKL